jgi:hypothetical protein
MIILRTKKRVKAKLTTMLFNTMANILSLIIEHGKYDGQLEGVVPHLVDCLSFNRLLTLFYL